MNPLQLKTDGLSNEGLELANALNSKLKELEVASLAEVKKAIDDVKSEFGNIVSEATLKEQIDEVKKLYAEQDADLKALKETGNNQRKFKSFGENIAESLKLHAKTLADLPNGKWVNFEIKAAGTMTTANVVPAVVGAIPYELMDFETGITRVQRRRPFLMDIVNVGRAASMYVGWAEMANPDPGVAGSVAEGAAKPATDFDIVEKTAKVEKIAVWIKVTKELLADLPGLREAINTELRELVLLKVDALLLSGAGATPDLKGLLAYATAFSAAPFTNLINNANNFDVLRVAINQIEKANFYPTHIILHPSDFAAMELTKNANDSYIMPPFAAIEGMSIKGIPIIANTGVPEGTFLVGDMSKAYFKLREDFNIQIGYVNDDFTKNLVTILGEMRGVFYIKTNHLLAFVYGTFATAAAALEKP